jgi:hypothetical protein
MASLGLQLTIFTQMQCQPSKNISALGKYIYPNPYLSLNIMYNKRIHFTIHFLHGPEQLSRYSDWLRAGRSGDRIPVEARFSSPVQTGPGTHPVSYTMGTRSLLGVKRPECDHQPLPSSPEVKERVELYLHPPSGPAESVLGWTLTFMYLTRLIHKTCQILPTFTDQCHGFLCFLCVL